jgi:cell wall-associated NlpC family hydrolase
MKKRLVLLALPALFTVSLAKPAHASGEDGDEVDRIEQSYDGAAPAIQTIMSYVNAQLGKPYAFGAAGPNAFDCSGLTLAAYRQVGIALPHGSIAQSYMGRDVDRADVQAGDLIFTRGGSPAVNRGHVGIAVSSIEMISAPHAGARVHQVRIPGGVQAIRRYVG